MYDATDDPYTYENSTVLVNKLGLRDQGELDNFEAEITNARAGEPVPEGDLDFAHFCTIHHICSRMYLIGQAHRGQSVFRSRVTHSASLSTSTLEQPSCSLI